MDRAKLHNADWLLRSRHFPLSCRWRAELARRIYLPEFALCRLRVRQVDQENR